MIIIVIEKKYDRNRNHNRYSKSTVIMIILNRNHVFLSIYHNKYYST